MALLRPGRCCCRRQGGCLQHRTEAQRRPKGQHAGGTPALPGNHSPLEGESQKPSRQAKADAVGGVWRATSQKADLRPLGNSRLPASRAPAPHDGADHSRKNGRSLMKTNHEWTRMNTNRPEDRWTSFNHKHTKMLLQFCALAVTMSWDDGFLGARASRPHQAWHSLGCLPHLDQPGTAPWLSFGLAAAVAADRVAACSIALKLSGGQRDSMRAGRPRSQAITPPLRGSRRSRAARRRLMRWGVSGGRLLRKPTCALWETPVCPLAEPPPPTTGRIILE